MPARYIDAATLSAATDEVNAYGDLTVDEQLAAAGIDNRAAHRAAANIADAYAAHGAPDRAATMAAFSLGLIVGARAARIAS